jgi:hypothetical protein
MRALLLAAACTLSLGLMAGTATAHPGHGPVRAMPYYRAHAVHFHAGYYYRGHEHHHWSYQCWDPVYRRYHYYDPGLCCYFWWCPQDCCYYPDSYCPPDCP